MRIPARGLWKQDWKDALRLSLNPRQCGNWIERQILLGFEFQSHAFVLAENGIGDNELEASAGEGGQAAARLILPEDGGNNDPVSKTTFTQFGGPDG